MGMKLTSTNIPTGANVIGIQWQLLPGQCGRMLLLVPKIDIFAHGVFGAFNSSADGDD